MRGAFSGSVAEAESATSCPAVGAADPTVITGREGEGQTTGTATSAALERPKALVAVTRTVKVPSAGKACSTEGPDPEVLSPKFQAKASALDCGSVLEVVSLTWRPGHGAAGVKATMGAAGGNAVTATTVGALTEERPPLAVAVTRTRNWPSPAKAWSTSPPAAEAPSPKSQAKVREPPIGSVAEAANRITSPGFAAVRLAVTSGLVGGLAAGGAVTTTATGPLVAERPPLAVAVTRTRNWPSPAKAWSTSPPAAEVPSPKSQAKVREPPIGSVADAANRTTSPGLAAGWLAVIWGVLGGVGVGPAVLPPPQAWRASAASNTARMSPLPPVPPVRRRAHLLLAIPTAWLGEALGESPPDHPGRCATRE